MSVVMEERPVRRRAPEDPAKVCHLSWTVGGFRFCGARVGTCAVVGETVPPEASPCAGECGRPRCSLCAEIYLRGEA